jgi:hypothetical protein
MMSGNIPESRASSRRNRGRLQIGMAGEIIPERWARSVRNQHSLDGFLKGGLGGRLSRYENALQRQLSALMLDLRRMQARRKAQGSPQARMEPAIGEGGGAVQLLPSGSQDAAEDEADPERPKRLFD